MMKSLQSVLANKGYIRLVGIIDALCEVRAALFL